VANQIRLINGSSRVIKAGDPCKLHATKKNSFDYAQLGDIIIGTAATNVSPGGWGTLNPQGTVQWENILNKPQISEFTQPEKSKLDNAPMITISDTAPDHPSVNDIWIDSSQN
jgi:hypothetical protein